MKRNGSTSDSRVVILKVLDDPFVLTNLGPMHKDAAEYHILFPDTPPKEATDEHTQA